MLGYAVFPQKIPQDIHIVGVRIDVSLISVEHATTVERTAWATRAAWAEKLDRV